MKSQFGLDNVDTTSGNPIALILDCDEKIQSIKDNSFYL